MNNNNQPPKQSVLLMAIEYLESSLNSSQMMENQTARGYYTLYLSSWLVRAINLFDYAQLGELIGNLGHFWFDRGEGFADFSCDAHNGFEDFTEQVIYKTVDAYLEKKDWNPDELLHVLKQIETFNGLRNGESAEYFRLETSDRKAADAWLTSRSLVTV